MRQFIILFLLILITASCGKFKHELEGEATAKVEAPERISLEPDFQKAAAFCDLRYKPNIVAAESCFLDFRTYYKPTVGIDLTQLVAYCANRYEVDQDIEDCEQDLLDIINSQELI